MSESHPHQPPRPTAGDRLHTLARAGISAIPFAGGTATELFQMIFAPPLERRRQRWMEDVAEALRNLEQREQIDLEQLPHNPIFIDTVIQASATAIRNHQQEKLEALRNAVLNAALPGAPDEIRQQLFLGLVDAFTLWHIRILRLLADPENWYRETHGRAFHVIGSGDLFEVVSKEFPELENQRPLVNMIAQDLVNRSLVEVGATSMTGQASEVVPRGLTSLGKEFITFIASPPASPG